MSYNTSNIYCITYTQPIRSIVPVITVTVSRVGTPTEGSPYTLTCMVSGHQSLMATETYQWSRSSGSLQGQANYTFNTIDRDDNGTYTCRVTINSPFLNSDIVEQDSITFHVTGTYLNHA